MSVLILNVKDTHPCYTDLLLLKEVKINKYLTSGGYGSVYLLQQPQLVIKIFNKDEKYNDENSEYYISKIIMELKNAPQGLVKYLARGQLNKEFTQIMKGRRKKHKRNSCFVIMHRYDKFYNINKAPKMLEHKFIIKFIMDVLYVCTYLEKEISYINLDVKTCNLMYDNNNLVLIDLGLMEKLKSKYDIYKPDNEKKYYLWPNKNCYMVTLPVYAMAINVLELFVGKNTVYKMRRVKDLEKYFNKIPFEDIIYIVKCMCSLKYDSITMYKYLKLRYSSHFNLGNEYDNLNNELEDNHNKNISSHNNKNIENNESNIENESQWYKSIVDMVYLTNNNEINKNNETMVDLNSNDNNINKTNSTSILSTSQSCSDSYSSSSDINSI